MRRTYVWLPDYISGDSGPAMVLQTRSTLRGSNPSWAKRKSPVEFNIKAILDLLPLFPCLLSHWSPRHKERKCTRLQQSPPHQGYCPIDSRPDHSSSFSGTQSFKRLRFIEYDDDDTDFCHKTVVLCGQLYCK